MSEQHTATSDGLPKSHNMPPEELASETSAPITHPVKIVEARYAEVFQRAKEIVASPLPEKIGQDQPDKLEAVTEVRMKAKRLFDGLEQDRLTEQRVWTELAEQTRLVFAPILLELKATMATCERLVSDFQTEKAEAARKLADEAAKVQREEAERRRTVADTLLDTGNEAAADAVAETSVAADKTAAKLETLARGSTADLVRTHTTTATVSSRAVWSFEIEKEADLRKTLGKLRDHFSKADMEKACRSFMNAEIKAGRDPILPGVRFWKGQKASFR